MYSLDITSIFKAKKDQLNYSYIEEWLTRPGMNSVWKEVLEKASYN